MILRSSFMISLAMRASSITMNNEVSSANNLILLVIPVVISLMYTRNSKGPKTEPWGYPSKYRFTVGMNSIYYDSL